MTSGCLSLSKRLPEQRRHMAVIKLSQLRHWRRRRFNWRLPVSEKASEVCAVPPPLLPLRLHHFHLHLCPSIYHSSTPLSIHLLPTLSQCLSFRRYQPPLSRSLSTPTQLHSFTCRYLSGWTNRLPRWCSRGNNKQVNMGGARTPRLCNNVQNTPSYVGHRFGFMLFFKGVFSVRGFKVTEGIFLES